MKAMQNDQRSMQTACTAARRWVVLSTGCVLLSAFLLSGCAKTQAASVPDGPPLAVPAAPPRVIGPLVEEPLAENPPEPEPAPTPPRTPTPARANPRPRAPTVATTPVEEPKPAETPAQPPPVVTEAPAPRPIVTQADAAADRRVREALRKAAADLAKVDYQKLSTNGKAQYEQSKRFNEQAEQELKDRNYMLAATLADKAAALATELQGR